MQIEQEKQVSELCEKADRLNTCLEEIEHLKSENNDYLSSKYYCFWYKNDDLTLYVQFPTGWFNFNLRRHGEGVGPQKYEVWPIV